MYTYSQRQGTSLYPIGRVSVISLSFSWTKKHWAFYDVIWITNETTTAQLRSNTNCIVDSWPYILNLLIYKLVKTPIMSSLCVVKHLDGLDPHFTPEDAPLVVALWGIGHSLRHKGIDRQTSNTRRNKSQNLNVSRLVLQLSLANPIKPGVRSRMKMYLSRRCPNCIWVTNNVMACQGACFIRRLTVYRRNFTR